MEYAHKVSELQVGKYYLVAHAVLENTGCYPQILRVPIIPIKHIDKDFAPKAPEHYHVDGRFNVSGLIKDIWEIDYWGLTNIIVDTNKKQGDVFTGIVYKKKQCKRLTIGLRPPMQAKSFHDWVRSQKGKSCAGRICPHFKAKMNLINGELICPMHGLAGDPITEVII